MSESVEQAALRRAERDELPAPWGSVLAAMEASERLSDSRYRHLTETRDAMYDEIAELRDGLLALSNRIEAVTRDHRTDASANFRCLLAGGGCNVGHVHVHDEAGRVIYT